MTPRNILVPIDFSQASEHALDYACTLGAKLGATVHLVNAVGVLVPELQITLSEAMREELLEDNRVGLGALADPRRALVTIGELIASDGDPRDVVLEVADKVHCDLIVMGTHGRRGLARVVLGSVAEDISRRASCPVLLVRTKKRSAS